MSSSILIYDCEIVKAIPPKDPKDKLEGIEYCEGWTDFEHMGISVVGCYDYLNQRSRVFCEDNLPEFQKLVDSRLHLVGFNSIPFDNQLLKANGIKLPDGKCYDILREMWLAAGLGPEYKYPSHYGYSLGKTCMINFEADKTGQGALAPVNWQHGKIGEVIDYCLNDIALTRKLLNAIIQGYRIIDPKTQKPLTLRFPKKIGGAPCF